MIETTFAMIKSKALEDGLDGQILSIILTHEFVIREARWTCLGIRKIAEFYREHEGKPYFHDLETSVARPVIIMALQRENAIRMWRDLLGATDPKKAEPGTIRYLARDEPIMANNAAHGSDSLGSANRELWMIFGRYWADAP